MIYVYHTPVLLAEVLHYLDPQPTGIYLDGTVGGGGHAEAILKRLSTHGRLVGLDADESAIRFSTSRLRRFGNRVTLVHSNFRDMKSVLKSLNIEAIDGLLLDLGVSHAQLDQAGRGFSFRKDERLDMRMDQNQKLDAWTVVNNRSERELAAIIWKYGEERRSRQLARKIVAMRRHQPINTTGDFAEIVRSVVGSRLLTKSLARVFQAIRIEVNNELENLQQALEDGLEVLRIGGRMVVLSYHSLEDRIVKNFFKEKSRHGIPSGNKLLPDRPQEPQLRILTRKPVSPSQEEIKNNPHARSAKLRAAEKIGG